MLDGDPAERVLVQVMHVHHAYVQRRSYVENLRERLRAGRLAAENDEVRLRFTEDRLEGARAAQAPDPTDVVVSVIGDDADDLEHVRAPRKLGQHYGHAVVGADEEQPTASPELLR